MNALATEQRKYDRQEPGDTAIYFRKDEVEFNADIHAGRFPTTYAADQQVECFIAELVAAPNKDIFLENNLGAWPRSASSEYALHVAVAQQWVKDNAAVGDTIGPVFWQWAKNATYTAMRYGWYPAQA